MSMLNCQGAFSGLVGGLCFCLFLTVGVIFNPRPKVSLPVYVDMCSDPRFEPYVRDADRTPKLLPWEYQPE